MFRFSRSKHWLMVPVATLAVGLVTADLADARPGSGRSVGSRGSNTYSAPPATSTAPKSAAPMERSMTQPGAAQASKQVGAATSTAASASRFGGMGGMMKGLLLGGLMGAAFASIFGGGALASMLGFLVQTALLVGVAMLIWSFFRKKSVGPAMATAAAAPAPTNQRVDQQMLRTNAAAMGSSGPAKLTLNGDDFNAFERLLGDVQTAYGRNDQRGLGDRVTPEMLSYFVEELTEDSKRGYTNEISNVKLLKGDLSEAWREAREEYATVAMRYSMIDAMIEKSSGNVINGSRTEAQEVTELWTFVRPVGGQPNQWELSAIQQAA